MTRDRDGRELKVGDRVMVPGVVTSVDGGLVYIPIEETWYRASEVVKVPTEKEKGGEPSPLGGAVCRSHGHGVLVTHIDDGDPCSDYLLWTRNQPEGHPFFDPDGDGHCDFRTDFPAIENRCLHLKSEHPAAPTEGPAQEMGIKFYCTERCEPERGRHSLSCAAVATAPAPSSEERESEKGGEATCVTTRTRSDESSSNNPGPRMGKNTREWSPAILALVDQFRRGTLDQKTTDPSKPGHATYEECVEAGRIVVGAFYPKGKP
jgi:hypothetical protein